MKEMKVWKEVRKEGRKEGRREGREKKVRRKRGREEGNYNPWFKILNPLDKGLISKIYEEFIKPNTKKIQLKMNKRHE